MMRTLSVFYLNFYSHRTFSGLVECKIILRERSPLPDSRKSCSNLFNKSIPTAIHWSVRLRKIYRSFQRDLTSNLNYGIRVSPVKRKTWDIFSPFGRPIFSGMEAAVRKTSLKYWPQLADL